MNKTFKIGLILSLLAGNVHAFPSLSEQQTEEHPVTVTLLPKKPVPSIKPVVALGATAAITGIATGFFSLALRHGHKNDWEEKGIAIFGGAVAVAGIGFGLSFSAFCISLAYAIKKGMKISRLKKAHKQHLLTAQPAV